MVILANCARRKGVQKKVLVEPREHELQQYLMKCNLFHIEHCIVSDFLNLESSDTKLTEMIKKDLSLNKM